MMNCETNDCRKEKRGCKGCFYNEGTEVTADEMFKELGYEKKEHNYKTMGKVYEYENDDGRCIDFMCENKEIKIWNILIDMQELQAINKKVQELGW